MLECLVLSVQVGKEMFCTFRQVQNSFQVDYFRTGIGYSGETMRQQLQVSHIFLYGFRGDRIIAFMAGNYIKNISINWAIMTRLNMDNGYTVA